MIRVFRTVTFTTIYLVFLASLITVSSVGDSEDIQGNWMGKLGELRVVFRITVNEDGTYTGFTDSPDQDAFDIPVNEVTFENGSVRFEVKSLNVVYEGKLVDGSTIEGELKPPDNSLPLKLKRIDEVPVRKHLRPQEPKKPYPYKEEEVVYENKEAGVKLAGTLTLPQSGGPFPAVLLIPGSGPNDRDELIWGHRVFLVLADHLTRQGIAVLRVDDRGVGGSTGDFSTVTIESSAEDALAGVQYLKTRSEIDPEKIGLIGHSYGGEIAPLAAAQSPDVAYIVLMAGSGMTLTEGIHLQTEAIYSLAGASTEAIALNRTINQRIFDILRIEKDDGIVEEKMREVFKELNPQVEELSEEDRRKVELSYPLKFDSYKGFLSPGFRRDLFYDPNAVLAKVKCPVLAIIGGKDTQVPPESNLKGIKEALRSGGNPDYTVKELSGLNHLFQTAQTGAPSEYSQIEETISPIALGLISGWIQERTGISPVPGEVHGEIDKAIEGNWYGIMKIPDGPELRLAIVIRSKLDGSVRATLISIDQGGSSLPIDKVAFAEGHLRLEISGPGVVIEGKLKEDGLTFESDFRQSGGVFPIEFKLVDEIPGLTRPQTPKPPYPYDEEEVVYEDKTTGIKFAGTLTLPCSEELFPVVLLISGSGPQDRDEFIAYHRPFLVLADYLTRRGIAVLRVDDRGVGGSTGEFFGATTEDFAEDAMAGVQYLKSRKDIDPGQIGLIGHSEGGMIAPMLASRSADIAFIVMMGGPGIGFDELIITQRGLIAKSEGASEEKAAALRKWYRDLYTVVKQEKDDDAVLEKMQGMYAEMSEQERELLGWSESEREANIRGPLNPWFRYALSYDPRPILMKVKCPVLAINGEKDILVTPKENLNGIEEALKAGGNQNYTIKELPSLNHLLQTADTGAEFEYVEIAETISPVALELIGDWILEQTDLR
ncbi:alpha/beta hydrolase family protein [Candidatus Poribacteria bacterium]